jgi:hypothetical protein
MLGLLLSKPEPGPTAQVSEHPDFYSSSSTVSASYCSQPPPATALTGSTPMLVAGDNPRARPRLAAEVGITGDEVHAGLLPQGKVEAVRGLEARGQKVLVLGDGVNDAPALASSASTACLCCATPPGTAPTSSSSSPPPKAARLADARSGSGRSTTLVPLPTSPPGSRTAAPASPRHPTSSTCTRSARPDASATSSKTDRPRLECQRFGAPCAELGDGGVQVAGDPSTTALRTMPGAASCAQTYAPLDCCYSCQRLAQNRALHCEAEELRQANPHHPGIRTARSSPVTS